MVYCFRCVQPVHSPVCSGAMVLCDECQTESGLEPNLEQQAVLRDRLEHFLDDFRASIPGRNDCVLPFDGSRASIWSAIQLKRSFDMNPLLVCVGNPVLNPIAARAAKILGESNELDVVWFTPNHEILSAISRHGFQHHGEPNLGTKVGLQLHSHRAAAALGIRLVVNYDSPAISNKFLSHSLYPFSLSTGLDLSDAERLFQSLAVSDEPFLPGQLDWLNPNPIASCSFQVHSINLAEFLSVHDHTPIEKEIGSASSSLLTNQVLGERGYREGFWFVPTFENCVSDYLKFVRDGIGLATHQASIDIRHELITRSEAIQLIQHHDFLPPKRSLARWLKFARISQSEFDRIADTFRDPNIWWIEDGEWIKDCVDGKPASFGTVKNQDLLANSQFIRNRSNQSAA